VTAAVRMPICAAEALSSSTAVSGNAMNVICEPTAEMVRPTHSLRKLGLCHRPMEEWDDEVAAVTIGPPLLAELISQSGLLQPGTIDR